MGCRIAWATIRKPQRAPIPLGRDTTDNKGTTYTKHVPLHNARRTDISTTCLGFSLFLSVSSIQASIRPDVLCIKHR